MPRFTPYRTTRTSPFISHLAYADDVLIFSAGDRASLKFVMEVLWSYERVSGQLINVQKKAASL